MIDAMSLRCLTCAHCTIESGWGGSDQTPGTPGQWSCGMSCWPETPTGAWEDRRPFILQCLSRGATCPHWRDDGRRS